MNSKNKEQAKKNKYTGYLKIRVRNYFLLISGLVLLVIFDRGFTWFKAGVVAFGIALWIVYFWVDKEGGIK